MTEPLPRIGAHLYTQGSLLNALLEAKKLKCQTLQFFLQSPVSWKDRELKENELQDFKETAQALSLFPLFAHARYLINLATPLEELRQKSLQALSRELKKAQTLELSGVVLHPGSHRGKGEAAGLKRVILNLNLLLSEISGFKTKIILETTAGQGSSLGGQLEQLHGIFSGVKNPADLGICLDTCHLFSAGYDLTSQPAYQKLMVDFERYFGFANLSLIHLNDSLHSLGSHRDRHWHIGKGYLGAAAFQRLLKDPRLKNIPMLIETPKTKGMDEKNLEALRRLRDSA